MTLPSRISCTRRQWLTAAAASACVLPSWANTGKPSGKGVIVAQLVDASLAQQDVVDDFLVGSRAAWQDINARGGLRGVPVQHQIFKVDGTGVNLHNTINKIMETSNSVLLCGTAGNDIAHQITKHLHKENISIAHAAPWLSHSPDARDERTFPIFANHAAQISYVLKSQANLGIQQLGVIYASSYDEALHQNIVQTTAAQLQINLQTHRGNQDLRSLGQKLGPNTPAVILFVGGTPELAQFMRGLEKQSRQRYVIGLADINLQTLAEMGTRLQTPVIAAQAVPLVSASLPIVRQYRQVLTRLFDEAPCSLSLSGYIAARYAYEVMNDISAPLTRANVLDAFQRRNVIDLGGFTANPNNIQQRFVTQSMLSSEGQLIG